MLVFRQLIDQTSSTYTYLIGDTKTKQCVLIDPVYEQAFRDSALINELDLTLVSTIDTHVHADHVTGAWLHKKSAGSQIIYSQDSGADGADLYVKDKDKVVFGGRFLKVRSTPGHTNGCISLIADDESMVFTGDCLLIRGTGRTDFQQGDPKLLFESVRSKIFSLPDSCLIYPGHDYRGLTFTSVLEERSFNPRLGGKIELSDFEGYMSNLSLPHPKQIDKAVPANLKCGQPKSIENIPRTPTWANIRYNFAGIWEIESAVLEEVIPDVQIVDVRESSEFEGPLGHIPGAILMPLARVAEDSKFLDKEVPTVLVCRSGARSAQAVIQLQKLGFLKLANLSGGMLQWRANGHAVTGGID